MARVLGEATLAMHKETVMTSTEAVVTQDHVASSTDQTQPYHLSICF